MKTLGAEILSLEDLFKKRPQLGRVVMTSGGFDPIHPGHISCIQESRTFGDVIVVVVNGDAFLKNKKGAPFQELAVRMLIVSAIRGVDIVVPYETETETTVISPLEHIRPDVFTKGGDRVDAQTIPEWECCKEYGIRIETGVGEKKQWSSSTFLESWDKRKRM